MRVQTHCGQSGMTSNEGKGDKGEAFDWPNINMIFLLFLLLTFLQDFYQCIRVLDLKKEKLSNLKDFFFKNSIKTSTTKISSKLSNLSCFFAFWTNLRFIFLHNEIKCNISPSIQIFPTFTSSSSSSFITTTTNFSPCCYLFAKGSWFKNFLSIQISFNLWIWVVQPFMTYILFLIYETLFYGLARVGNVFI
jgi:hypothetical protein